MLPNNTLSTQPIPAPFLAPRTGIRFSTQTGLSDVHLGGIAIGDPSQGVTYQLWSAFVQPNGDIWIESPNTLAAPLLVGVNATWVALAFDQNARIFIAYATETGNAFYYWFDSTIPGYRTSALSGAIFRVFAALDDSRPAESSSSDVILAYTRANELFMRVQRDRFGIEYDLGAAPAILVQVGLNRGNRFQFAFQNVQGNKVLPPAEFLGSQG